MSRDLVKVRAIRPHDTSGGFRAPGDEYDRPRAEAEDLAARGVVTFVAAKPKPKRK